MSSLICLWNSFSTVCASLYFPFSLTIVSFSLEINTCKSLISKTNKRTESIDGRMWLYNGGASLCSVGQRVGGWGKKSFQWYTLFFSFFNALKKNFDNGMFNCGLSTKSSRFEPPRARAGNADPLLLFLPSQQYDSPMYLHKAHVSTRRRMPDVYKEAYVRFDQGATTTTSKSTSTSTATSTSNKKGIAFLHTHPCACCLTVRCSCSVL